MVSKGLCLLCIQLLQGASVPRTLVQQPFGQLSLSPTPKKHGDFETTSFRDVLPWEVNHHRSVSRVVSPEALELMLPGCGRLLSGCTSSGWHAMFAVRQMKKLELLLNDTPFLEIAPESPRPFELPPLDAGWRKFRIGASQKDLGRGRHRP